MKNKNLAIVIPTCNRSQILQENLLIMLNDIKKYSLPLYISDDSNNNETKNMVETLKKDYEHIFYYQNTPSLGHDKNCLYSLGLANEDYIWYLGDSIAIENRSISRVINLIKNNNYDFIVTNHNGRNLNLPSKFYDDAKDVFSELSWHLTLTGVTIYNKKTLTNTQEKADYRNFPQTFIVLNSLTKKCNLYYDSQATTFKNKKKVSYWSNNLLEVFAKDWYTFIYSLPDFYTLNEKLDVIKSHSVHTGIFSLHSIRRYKQLGILNFKTYTKYFKYINYSSHENKILIFLILLIPEKFLSLVQKVKHLIHL